MSSEAGTSRGYIARQYADDRNLAARQSIYAYQRPQLDLHNSSLDLAALGGDEAVLDIGCGNGRYLDTFRAGNHRGLVVGADLSEGMLRTARPATDGPLLVSDAQVLPFRSASFDVVLAMHMLYHVPDRARAIREIRRVVRPGGIALALTNSETHFQELDELLVASAVATIGAEHVRSRPSLTLFNAETAAPELEVAFADVTPHLFAAELVVDDPAPLIAYARSMGAFVADDAVDRTPILSELERRVTEVISTTGAFRVTTACSVFVCRG